MRVLWVSHVVPYPPTSGVVIRAFHLLKAVASRHDVDLVAFVQEPLLAAAYPTVEAGLRDARAVLSGFCDEIEFIRVQNLARPFGKLRTALESLVLPTCYSVRWASSAEMAAKLTALGARHKYDVVHFDTVALAQYRSIFAGTPATLGHHNVESHMMHRRAMTTRNPIKRLYFGLEARRLRRFERDVGRQFALHAVCSDLDRSRLANVDGALEIACVPNGVDCAYWVPRGVRERSESAVFVGTLNWYPNAQAVQFLAEKVWPLVRQRCPNATLDIVGAHASAGLRHSVARSPGVVLRGFVDDVREPVESASVCVCPITDGGGTKLKVLEAFALQRCMIAHPIACEGIRVTPGDNVVFAETAEQFAESIVRLFPQIDERARIGAAARRLVEQQYSFSAIGSDFCDRLEKLVQAG